MPVITNSEATTFLVTFSIFCTTRKALLTFCKLKAIKKANIITGNPVPKANSGGNNIPPVDFNTRGIKAPKNKTPLYGQKARANNMPSNNEPTYPLPESQIFAFSIIWLEAFKFIFMTLNITSPITISTGPKTLSPQP